MATRSPHRPVRRRKVVQAQQLPCAGSETQLSGQLDQGASVAASSVNHGHRIRIAADGRQADLWCCGHLDEIVALRLICR